MARPLLRALLWVFVVALVGCDHATKYAAQAGRGAGATALVPKILELRYTENHDTAFSLLDAWTSPHKPLVLTALSVGALAFVFVAWWARRRGSRREHAAFALITAGAVGNILDRAGRGYVIDFIHVTHWPVFNVADILVGIGVALLAIDGVSRRRPSRLSSRA